jgi:hypothetical protein
MVAVDDIFIAFTYIIVQYKVQILVIYFSGI